MLCTIQAQVKLLRSSESQTLARPLGFGTLSPAVSQVYVFTRIDLEQVVFQALARLHGSWLKWQHLVGPGDRSDGIRTQDLEGLCFEMQPFMVKSSAEKTIR